MYYKQKLKIYRNIVPDQDPYKSATFSKQKFGLTQQNIKKIKHKLLFRFFILFRLRNKLIYLK